MRENGDLATRLTAAGRDLCGPPSDAVVTAIMSRLSERRPRRSWRAPLAATAAVLAGTVAAAALAAGPATSGMKQMPAGSLSVAVQPEGCVAMPGAEFVPMARATEVTEWVLPATAFGTPVGIYRMFDDSVMLSAPYRVTGALVTVERYGPEVTVSTANSRVATTPTTVGQYPGLWYRSDEAYELRYQGDTPNRGFGGAIDCKGSRLTWVAKGYTYAVSGPVDDSVLMILAEAFV
ncbi:hypothetical protein LV79_005707 [Actinokineospora globicatena]|uniref:hypothetical protein n=1 Tax=Actinokineospora globicatena TaxID=103729 RepID=UPI0020A3FA76|nr:hypothetical protein [Actinokineospora globicatena]MCP2305978.1 hypothetical protein [Actinokineospora globicatena]GLW80151.1 hypothetical protein Aglo01_46320 [Actinokineospora globicatena]GLW86980.1 hypothetical protein Aglo02_46190 [Actinokineospora globicatena]